MTKFDIRFSLLSKTQVIKDISYKELDDIKYTGIYEGFEVISAPDEGYVQIIVTKHSETWVVQECKNYVDKLFLRSYKNGRWNKWTEIEPELDEGEPDKEFIVVDRPHSHATASNSNDGFMSKTDKANLNFIVSYLKDHGLDMGGDGLPPIQETIDELKANVTELSETKADINHDHDKKYIPTISNLAPSDHSTKGQVWIQVNK